MPTFGMTRRRFSLQEFDTLLARARGGDEYALDRVFGFLRARLLVLARQRVRESAEDTVQETLLVVHNRFSEFNAVESLLAFTNQVLRNKIGNVYQRRSRRKHVELQDNELRYDIDNELDALELERIIRDSIAKLGITSPVCKAILSSLYNGLEPDEISHLLGIPKGRLKVRTFRCRVALRDILTQEYRLQL